MRAVSRFGKALLAGALALAPGAALAQQAPAVSNTPAVDTIGPRELQNFTLNGTVTRPADQPATAQPRARTPRTEPKSTATTGEQTSSNAPAPKPRPVEKASAAQPARAEASAVRASSASAPPLPIATAAPAAPPPAPTFAADPAPSGTLAPQHKFPLLPWLLAALALGAGGAFLFFRNRSREAFAGGPEVDAFVAPAPAQPPAAAPGPAAPASAGIVSTRLRPWIEIGFTPLRCVLDSEKVTVDFEVELFNSGSAPARGVLVEASLFNAGPDQDQQIGAFFAKPDSGGDRIEIMPPMKRMTLRTKVSVPTDQMQAYDLAGRPALLPVIAFNALYSRSGGDGQTSASYLLGRDTKSDKMGPFHLDLGARIFRGVGARLLPQGIRR